MARLARRLAGFRRIAETFKRVRWNRLWHEKHKPTDPRFSVACKPDWSKALKRPDLRHFDRRQFGIVARDLGGYRVIYSWLT